MEVAATNVLIMPPDDNNLTLSPCVGMIRLFVVLMSVGHNVACKYVRFPISAYAYWNVSSSQLSLDVVTMKLVLVRC